MSAQKRRRRPTANHCTTTNFVESATTFSTPEKRSRLIEMPSAPMEGNMKRETPNPYFVLIVTSVTKILAAWLAHRQ
jgi:hypothetical protein